MAAPTLGNYEYQLGDTGIKLNGTSTLPFFDIDKVAGLDMPKIEVKEDSLDAQHGGVVFGKYFQPRTIIIDGAIYADPTTVDSYIDSLISNYMPSESDTPFYFKHPGVTQRYVLCRPVGFNYDIERLRAYGKCSAQLQLKAGDPRKYVDNADQVMTVGSNYTPTNTGNMETYPIFVITGAWSTITFTNNTAAKSVVLTDTRVAGDITVINFKDRSVIVNGSRKSSIVSTGNWWNIPSNNTQTVKYTVTGGPPTSVVMSTKQGWA